MTQERAGRLNEPSPWKVASLALMAFAVLVPPITRLGRGGSVRHPQGVAGAPHPDELAAGQRRRALAERRLLAAEWFALALVVFVLAYLLVKMSAAPIYYADSGTVLSISRRLANADAAAVWNTQSPPLQDGVYAALIAAGLNDAVHAPVLMSSLLLALLLGWVAWRATGVVVAAALPPAVLLFSPSFWTQSSQLPFYPTFALLGYAGTYLAISGIVRPSRPAHLVWGGLLIAAALYAFTLALVFVLVPALALAVFFKPHRIWRAALLYAVLLGAASPLILWHLSVGGVAHFHYHPYGWFPAKYAAIVVPRFWGNALDVSLPEYARIQFDVFTTQVIETWVFALVIPGFIYVWQRFGFRAAAFCLASIAMHLGLLIATRPSAHARYHFAVLPLLVLLASGGLYWLSTLVCALLRDTTNGVTVIRPRHVLMLATLSVGVLCLISAPNPPSDAHAYYVERPERDKALRDIRAITSIMDGSHGGIIARDSAIQFFVPDNQVYTHFLLSEDEYVTYLTWPDDATVIRTLASHGIEWVLIRNNPLRWERDYNVWVEIAYGKPPVHYVRVRQSPAFEEVYSGYAYRLYHLRLAATAVSYSRSR